MSRRRTAAAWIAVAVVAAGCSTGDGLGEREARLELPQQRVDLAIDGCAKDGDVVVLGASTPTVLLQVLLQLDGDGEVDLDESGITATVGTSGTLGAGDAGLIGSETGASGAITEASVRGDRIEVVARAVRTTRDGDVEEGRLELAARCTPEDDVAAPAR